MIRCTCMFMSILSYMYCLYVYMYTRYVYIYVIYMYTSNVTGICIHMYYTHTCMYVAADSRRTSSMYTAYANDGNPLFDQYFKHDPNREQDLMSSVDAACARLLLFCLLTNEIRTCAVHASRSNLFSDMTMTQDTVGLSAHLIQAPMS